MRSAVAICLIAVVSSVPARSTTIVLNAVDRGWYEDTGWRKGGWRNTFTGQDGTSGTVRYRSFFVFDLSGVPPISGATLRLELEWFFGPDPTEVIDIYDVATFAGTVIAAHSPGSPEGLLIYEDLGTGPVYSPGFVILRSQDWGQVLDIELDQVAVARINSMLGAKFVVGVRLREPFTLASGDEGVRFSMLDEPRIHQLALTPGTVAVNAISWARIKALYR